MPGAARKVARATIHAYVQQECAAVTSERQAALRDFVVITGFSGAGKSQAMASFEDAGYFCVDNLPPEMIGSLADLFGHEGSKVERAAVVSRRARRRVLRRPGQGARRARARRRAVPRCCSSRPPRRCWSTASRRRAGAIRWRTGGSVEAAIREERELLAPLTRAGRRLDRHHRPVRRAAAQGGGRQDARRTGSVGRLAVTFLTFGFKHGTRATPTSPSTSASCPTRTTRPSCATSPGWTRPSSTTSRAPTASTSSTTRADPAARLPAARVRAGGQGAPDDRHRLHGRPAPLGRDRRAPRAGIRGARRPASSTSCTATYRSRPGAPEIDSAAASRRAYEREYGWP